ncbi:MAG: GPO family capsid scaffolding protein [Azoarcus sp.]|jgi:hypothetical protein|nr:GPO family capsid scaffolding protein [Azoarcus sp.]
MPVTKPFAIATEGPTVDGRVITRQQIEDMAKHYDPATYAAVVNLEHYIAFTPDTVFSAYGKVLELGTREAEILGEKRLQLTAVAEVLPKAVELQKKGQKAFASMEIIPNFAGKGITYLTGLALTDSPASLGTESMKFSAFSEQCRPEKYAFPDGFDIEFEPEPGQDDDKPSVGDALVTRVKELLGLTSKTTAARFAAADEAITAIATSQRELLDDFAVTKETLAAITKQLGDLASAHSGLVDTLAAAPDEAKRPTATGAVAAGQTDC